MDLPLNATFWFRNGHHPLSSIVEASPRQAISPPPTTSLDSVKRNLLSKCDISLTDYAGTWQIHSRTDITAFFDSFTTNYLVLDITNSLLSVYAGINEYPRLPIPNYDFQPQDITVIYSLNLDGSLSISRFPDARFSLDPKKNTLYVSSSNNQQHTIFQRYLCVSKLLSHSTQLDWNDNTHLFDYYADALIRNYTSFVPKNLCNDQFDYDKTKKTICRYLKGETVKYSAKIINVEPSKFEAPWYRNLINDNSDVFGYTIPGYLVTTFILDVNPFNPASRVHISKFKREYAVLNGDWDLDPLYITNNTLPAGFVHSESVRYTVNIQYDSRHLPAYDSRRHGHAKIKAKSKLTSEYRSLMSALYDIQRLMGLNVHANMTGFVNVDVSTGHITFLNTYEDVRQRLQGEGKFAITQLYYNGGLSNAICYRNLPELCSQVTWGFMYDLNNRHIDASDSKYRYLVPLNYLIPDSIRTLYYKIQKNGFDFKLDTLTAILPGYNRSYDIFQNVLIGQIRPELVGGRKIGYLNIIDYVWVGWIGYLYGPGWNPAGNINGNALNAVSTVIEYFSRTLDVDDLILDQRINEGGSIALAWSLGCACGSFRKGMDDVYAETGGKSSKTYLPTEQLNSCAPFAEQWYYSSIDPSKIPYPFAGGIDRQRRIILLTSQYAESAADLICGFVLGDLGSNTFGYTIGNLDGRINGYGCPLLAPPANNTLLISDPKIADMYKFWTGFRPLNTPVVPYLYSYERGAVLQFRSQDQPSSQFNSKYKPVVLVDPHYEVTYRDFGHEPSENPYLIGTPNPDNNTTWADTWIEETLKYLMRLVCQQ